MAMIEVAERRKRGQEQSGGWGETVRTVVYAMLIALVVRTFAIEPFNIPSGSMIPTLLVGDYLFVSKYSYGYSKHSFPFSAGLFPGRIFKKMPERGDVAVFKYPGDQGQGVARTDYIKRIVGLPGDRIQVTNGVLHINGEAVERIRIGDYVKGAHGQYQKGTLYSEKLPTDGATPCSNIPTTARPTTRRNSWCRPTASSSWATTATTHSIAARGSRCAISRACRASATNSAGTCLMRILSAAPNSSSSATTRRPPAGRSRGSGPKRSASAASSRRSTEDCRRRPACAGRRHRSCVRQRRACRRSAHASQRARSPAGAEGRVPQRQRAPRIPGRPCAFARDGRLSAAPVPA